MSLDQRRIDALGALANGRLPKQLGGFEPDPEPEQCRNSEHQPPTHLHIPQGMRYRHICPQCGHQVMLRASPIRY